MKEERTKLKRKIKTIISAIDKIVGSSQKENLDKVTIKQSALPDLIEQFEEVHSKLIEKLDEEEIDGAERYRAELLGDYESCDDAAKVWIEKVLNEKDKESDKPNNTNDAEEKLDNTSDTDENFDKTSDADENADDNETDPAEYEKVKEKYESAKRNTEKAHEVMKLLQETHELKMQEKEVRRQQYIIRQRNKIELLEKEKQCRMEREAYDLRIKQLENEMNNPQETSQSSNSVSSDDTPLQASGHSRSSFESSPLPPEQLMMKAMMTEVLSESRRQQQVMIDSMQLPRMELQTFDGNPLKYWGFMQSFKSSVGRRNVDADTKLSCLRQYCKGQARKILECTENMNSEEGYQRALEILEGRYGDTDNIAQRWISKITERSNVKGAADLREFADELQCCYEMLKNMGHAHDLNNNLNLRCVWKKLPQYLQDRWMHRNYQIKKVKKSKADFGDIVAFITEAAEEANDPIFSRDSKPEHKSTNDNRSKQKSFSTTSSAASNKGGKCPCCDQKHYLPRCDAFKAMKVKERREMVMKKGLCRNCFAKGHISKNCPQDFTCGIEGCGLKHSRYLHLKPRTTPNEDESTPKNPPAHSDTQQLSPHAAPFNLPQLNGNACYTSSCSGKLAMPIVAVQAWNQDSGEYKSTYALLDPGSNSTYCTSGLQKQLGIRGTAYCVELSTLTASQMQLNTTKISLEVSSMNDEVRHTISAVVRPDLHIDTSSTPTSIDIARWPHLSDITIPELENRNVELLIGQDYADLLLPEEVRRGEKGEPFAVLTPLGWIFNGLMDRDGVYHEGASYFVQRHAVLEKDLNRLWNIEGIHDENKTLSRLDENVLSTWNESLEITDQRYTMPIPFKRNPPNLPNNKQVAEKRLQSLQKRLNKDANLKERYTEELNKLLEKGYAEEVPQDDKRDDGKVWYLPHHPVFNPKKPEKCRVVFDCAAKYGGASLNDHINQGPDLTNKLVGVLLRFRQGKIGFTADIEAMFHQVLVSPDDRDVLRFLWMDASDASKLKTYRMKAHLFGGVWSPSCANFALKKAAEEFKCDYPEEVVTTIDENFYVDDCLRSTDSLESATAIALQTKKLLAERGFNLTKYVSSSPALMQQIPKCNWGKSVNFDLNMQDKTVERALGMLWNTDKDCLEFDTQIPKKPKTKRGILSTLSSIYDPLGYVSPVILRARRMFQELCRKEKTWDDPLDSVMEEAWDQWLEELPSLANFSISRCIKPSAVPIKEAELHHFSDASQYAYGAVSYLRMTLEDNTIHTCIMMAKSRLAPMKGATIPRLELAGALEAVRLDKILIEEMSIPLKTSVFWTDSQIVLWYINNSEQRYQTYVANRVAKVTEHTRPEQWRFVPTEENPGDDASRGFSAKDLPSSRWRHGPKFLIESENKWPSQPDFTHTEFESELEIKHSSNTFAAKEERDPTNYLLNYFSSWYKLRKAVVYFRRFQRYLMNKKIEPQPVTVKEMKEVENAIIKHVQKDLRNTKQLQKLNPIVGDDGIQRVGGRLANSTFKEDSKHPVILPYNHSVSKLVIMQSHHITGHAGVERVLGETRRKYWIMRGRKMVKSTVYSCIKCKQNHGKACVQKMADLPQSRVTPYEPPFSHVGVDYFGPFIVKRGRSEIKRYGCIFTCFATRAIHIEMAYTMDTDSFIHALDRFTARRGEPKEIWSDNGTNFIGASQELKRAVNEWNQNAISTHLLKREIDWHFNPPAASHMGGVWERQVRTIRKVLMGVISQQTLNDEALMTLLTIVEGIVNNRPITRLSDDPRDETPLTPNHLLLLRQGPSVPPGLFVERDQYRRRWRSVQYLADLFWKRWITEYIPRLQERQKWVDSQRNVKVGDLVLVNQSNNTPRNKWPLGIVTNVYRSKDGHVRSVELRTTTGTYERPIAKLCLLEGAE